MLRQAAAVCTHALANVARCVEAAAALAPTPTLAGGAGGVSVVAAAAAAGRAAARHAASTTTATASVTAASGGGGVRMSWGGTGVACGGGGVVRDDVRCAASSAPATPAAVCMPASPLPLPSPSPSPSAAALRRAWKPPYRCFAAQSLGPPPPLAAVEAPEAASSLESAAPSNSGRHLRVKTKALTKQAKHIMNILDAETVSSMREERDIPDFQPGDVLAMKVEVPENKRRVSVVRGIVIARRNAGASSTFRIRRMMAGVGVEMLFPLYSPNIKEMKVVERRRVRRAKLYYLRDKIARLSTV